MFLIDTTSFNGTGYSTSSNGIHVDYSGSLYNDGGENLTIDEYCVIRGLVSPQLINVDAFITMLDWINTEKYIKPPVAITEQEYREALEVLPPENWCRGVFEHFRMCEYLTGSITAQYACKDSVYITKNIDAFDKTTWITLEDFSCI